MFNDNVELLITNFCSILTQKFYYINVHYFSYFNFSLQIKCCKNENK